MTASRGTTGGRFCNREGQLPSATCSEYDVYSRNRGAARDAYRIVVNRSAARDAYRIVVNRSTRAAYFTPDLLPAVVPLSNFPRRPSPDDRRSRFRPIPASAPQPVNTRVVLMCGNLRKISP
jgi:hypothetical protein